MSFALTVRNVVRARTVAAIFALAAGISAASFEASAAIFGRDDRAPLSRTEKAFGTQVGALVVRSSAAFCTAFCAGPDLIATASHCVHGSGAEPPPALSELAFKFGPRDGAGGVPIAGAASVASGTAKLALTPPIGAARDWAILRLERPVCGAPLPISSLSPDAIHAAVRRGDVYQIAHHRDVAEPVVMRGGPCRDIQTGVSANLGDLSRDFDRPDQLLFHTCDTGPGSSGSPLLIDGINGPEVVAINVGTYVLSRNLLAAEATGDRLSSEPVANTAILAPVLAPVLAEALSEFPPATRQMAAHHIRRLQMLLRDVTFYDGVIDGRMSPGLERAIRAYELSRGWTPTGAFHPALIDALEARAPVTIRRSGFLAQ